MKEPIPMSLECADCGSRVHNDDPELQSPHDFITAAKVRGWRVDTHPPRPPSCPLCVAKGK